MADFQPEDDVGWKATIDAHGAWRCEHCDLNGDPAPPARLNANDAMLENLGDRLVRRRGRILCPDCGTHWRVWQHQKVAKLYVASPWGWKSDIRPLSPPRYRRRILFDIDRIIEQLRELAPDLRIEQYSQSWPADDDGLWFFKRPGTRNHVQIESSYGRCPFVIEHSLGSERYSEETVEGVVARVLDLARL